jgi:hypothetical protein
LFIKIFQDKFVGDLERLHRPWLPSFTGTPWETMMKKTIQAATTDYLKERNLNGELSNFEYF